jgi:hypothetical protein
VLLPPGIRHTGTPLLMLAPTRLSCRNCKKLITVSPILRLLSSSVYNSVHRRIVTIAETANCQLHNYTKQFSGLRTGVLGNGVCDRPRTISLQAENGGFPILGSPAKR